MITLKRLATHLLKPPQRFDPLTSEEDFRCTAKSVIPLTTKSWALCSLHNWMESRNSNRNEKVPEDLLSCPDVEVVCK